MRMAGGSPGRLRTISGTAGGFRIFGVTVRFHSTFLLLLVLLMAAAWRRPEVTARDVTLVTALFGSVLLHELAHAMVARRYGVRTLEIVLFPIGGLARLERPPRPRDELWISVAGPLMNLALAAALVAWLWTTAGATAPEQGGLRGRQWYRDFLAQLALGNWVLGGFNLVPAFPMDGGRLLRSLLARRYGEARATEVASRLGRVLAVVMGVYGLASMNPVLVFIAVFVYLGALQEVEMVARRSLLAGATVRDATLTQFHTLGPGDTLRLASEVLAQTAQQDFPVVLGQQVVGLLDRTRLSWALAQQMPEAWVASVMDRQPPRLAPAAPLGKAVELLAGGVPCALVMEGEQLVGLLTPESVSKFLQLHQPGLSEERR